MPNRRETDRFSYPCPYGSGLWYTRKEYLKEFGMEVYLQNNEDDLPHSFEKEWLRIQEQEDRKPDKY